MIEFFVPGPPVPWQRARTKRGQFYNPRKMRDWQHKVAWCAKIAMGPLGPTASKVSVTMRVRRQVRRGDLSNYVKAVEDAIRGIVYRDDAQVSGIDGRFVENGPAGVQVEVVELP